MKALGRISITNVAYVCLLLGFVALGAFVYALATASHLAGVIGVGLVACAAAAVAGFRAGARRLAQSGDADGSIDGANIWAQPLRRAQIDRYLSNYRSEHTSIARNMQAMPATDDGPTPAVERRAA